MTFPDALADDRWTLPTWGDGSTDRGWRLPDWLDDPPELAMLVAIAVLGAVLVVMLAGADRATAAMDDDACVMTAVDDARAFAHVLGDDRFVPVSFAVEACARS